MRQIVLDTETTGLTPEDGHRIIEIGCVEMLNRVLTGNRYHVYLNPERQIDAGAAEVHGLTNEFLSDRPLFADVAEDFLAFVAGAELIIHNAPFDVGFLNKEFSLLGRGPERIEDYCPVTDTLVMAKRKHPGQRNSLDALCKRYGVDNRHRDLHGALLDAEILAQVYLLMTGGQIALLLEPESASSEASGDGTGEVARLDVRDRPLRVIRCSETELAAHESRLEAIDKLSGGRCLWRH